MGAEDVREVEGKLMEATSALERERLAREAQASRAQEEMLQQRSAIEDWKKREKQLEALVAQAQAEKQDLQMQLQRSLNELMEQTAKVFDQSPEVQIRERLMARENELLSVRSELEQVREALSKSREFEKGSFNLQVLEEERDALKARLELEVPAVEEVVKEKQHVHQQLQIVAKDLTLALGELDGGEHCPRQMQLTKQVLTNLQEQITSVCEELLIERPMSRRRREKSSRSSEHAGLALQVIASEHEDLQRSCKKLNLGCMSPTCLPTACPSVI